MRHTFGITFAVFWVLGFFAVNTAAVHLMAQESSEDAKQERGYYMPTQISVRYMDAKVIGTEGIPEWLAEAVKVIREFYPLYDKYLESEGHVPSGNVTLQAESSGPIGWNSSTTIGFSIEYIAPGRGGEKDWGMIAHELVHFVQGYPGGAGTGVPGWITEGIGDYVRHAMFEPKVPMRPIGRNARYQDAYQTSAGFLMWITEHYNLDIVPLLNVHGRKRTYSPAVFVEYTGKELDELWAEYRETVILPLANGNRRMIPAEMFPKLMKHLEEFKAHVATLSPEPRPAQGQRGGGRDPVNTFVPTGPVVVCTLGCNARPCACVIEPQYHALVFTYDDGRTNIGGLPYATGTAFVTGKGKVNIAFPTSHGAGGGLLGSNGINTGQLVRIGNLVEDADTDYPLYRVAAGGIGNDGLLANVTLQAIRREATWTNGTIPAAVTWMLGGGDIFAAGRRNTVIGLVTAYNDGTFTIESPLSGSDASATFTLPGNKDASIWNFPTPRGPAANPRTLPVEDRYKLNEAEIRAINNKRVNPSADPYSVYAIVVHAPGNMNEVLSVAFITDHVVRADASSSAGE